MKRYSDAQIDEAALTAMDRAAALEPDPDIRERQLAVVADMREQLGRIPSTVQAQGMRLYLRLFIEAIHQLHPARPGTPQERQKRIDDRIEARKAKRLQKGRK